MRALAIAIHLRGVALAGIEEVRRHAHRACLLVGDRAQVPVIASTVLAHDRDHIADLARQHARVAPVGRHVLDEGERVRARLVMLRQIGGHLHRRVQHHHQCELPCQRARDVLLAPLQRDDAGRVVHGPCEHAGEEQVDLVLRRIGRLAPRLVLHAACTFAREPVWIRATQPGVLDRFVRVDRDLAFRRFLDHAQVVVAHPLAVMPLAQHRSADHVLAPDLACIAHITGLDRVDAKPRIQVERGAELAFVMADRAAGLVMADQMHPFGLRIRREALDIEVRRRAGEVEIHAVGKPLAIPARVPAFDQHPAEAVLRREVDVAHRVGGRRAVLRAGRPALGFKMQRPPDADVLAGLEPRHVAQCVRRVEVQERVGRHRQLRSGVGREDHAPRCLERCGADHRRSLW